MERLQAVLVFVFVFVFVFVTPSFSSSGLFSVPDLKPLIMQGYGLRKAIVVNDTTVQAIIGASSVEGRNKADNWRIVSTEDERYAYARFVNVVTARTDSLQTEFARPADIKPFSSSSSLPLTRSVVTLTLPYPLRRGVTYSIISQGKGLDAVTCGLCAVEVTPGETPPNEAFANEREVAARLTGIRRVGYLGDGKLVVECGPGFSAAAGRQTERWKVTINGKAVPVQAFGRRSKLECYQPEGWPYKGFIGHDIFLNLATPLHNGDRVTVAVDTTVTAGCRTASLHYEEDTTPTRAIKVNQLGYLPHDIKVAYLGYWLGSMPEGDKEPEASPVAPPPAAAEVPLDYDSLAPYALRFRTPPTFRLVDDSSGATVWQGRSTLIHNGRYADGGVNHSAENVYELDFRAFDTPGRYRLVVEGVGCSLPFDIADDIYRRAFKVQAQGIYAQRCGCPIDPNLSGGWERIACHDEGIAATDLRRQDNPEHPAFSQHLRLTDGHPTLLSASGGHHDAGDYNPRSHIDVAQTLMTTYEMSPRLFTDNQLNVPERGNGIPDIMDEALWQVKLWEGLQDADGGVAGGTESEGDPSFTQTVELDDKGDYAWAKDTRSSYLAAGTFSQASRILRSLGHRRKARHLLACARKAYTWATAHTDDHSGKADSDKTRALRAYAACELYHTTREKAYHEDFKALTAPSDGHFAPRDDRDMMLAAYSYLLLPVHQADTTLRSNIEAVLLSVADFYVEGSSKMAYKFIRHPYAPITWGTGAYESYAVPVAFAWWLTGKQDYRDWLIRTCDNTLGANPMGLSWITGLGQRTIRCPLHSSRYRPGGLPVAGLQAQGPNRNGDGYSWRETVFPAHDPTFAVMQAFSDLHYAIVMNEPTVNNMANTLMVFGLLSGEAGENHP